jgi:protein-serine/threonine kinase
LCVTPIFDVSFHLCLCGRINEVKAKIMFKQILEVILEMKENGILHFDIKDENILVDIKNEKIKIMDFGAGEYYKTDDFNDYQGLLFQLLIE